MPRSTSRIFLMMTCLLLVVGYLAFGDISSTRVAAQGTPTLNINNVILAEGNSGTTSFTFTVSLTAPAGPGGVTFDIATANNTATTANNDYVEQSLTGQVISSGLDTYSFTVLVNGDTDLEANETFFVNITNVVGANSGDSQGQGTITNDDSPPVVTVVAQTADISEDSFFLSGIFRITRTGSTTSALTVAYTLGGTADSADYTPTLTGTASIPVGETFVDVEIFPFDDSVNEANPETLILTLTDTADYDLGVPSSATINIADDDIRDFTVDATSDPGTTTQPDGLAANITAGETVTLRMEFVLTESTTISLSASSAFGSNFTYVANSARVSYQANALPSFNGDFAGIQNQTEPSFPFPAARVTVASSTVTFDFGSVINNDGDGGTETLIIEYDLVPAGGAVVGTPVNMTYTVTIDQGLPTEVINTSNAVVLTIVSPPLPVVTVAAQDGSAAEAGSDPGTFRITRTGPTTSALSVDYTLGGTAVAGDYTPALTGTVSIPIGSAFVDVTITPVDDFVDEADPETLTLTLTDTAAYDLGAPSSATVNIADDDTAGVTISESGGNTSVVEGGAGDSYTVVLTSQPTSNVTVNISFDASQLVVDGDTDGLTSLVFTPSDWNTAQMITVFAVNDATIEGNPLIRLISHTFSSADANYSGLSAANVTVSITDNDTATVLFATPTTTVSEALSSVSITVRLDVIINGTPGGTIDSGISVPITLTLGSAEADDLTLTTTQVIFPPGSVNGTTRFVDVTIANDQTVEGDETATLGFGVVTGTAVTSGTHELTISDDDTAGFTVTESGGSTAVSEDGTSDTFTVVLDEQPLTDVVILIEVALADQDEIGAAPPSLTFTNLNWNTPQLVTVTGVDDAVDDGDQIVGVGVRPSGALSDPAFAGLPGQIISVTNSDNDTAGFTVTETGGSTAVSESGTSDTFTVVLNAQPLTDVVMLIEVALGDLDEVGAAPPSLTFTNANWNTPQLVTVTGIDDAVDDGDQIVGVGVRPSGALSDPAFAGLPGQIISVTNADNDAAGITVTESGGSTAVTEGGATDTFTVVLTSQPTADVSIALTGSQVTTGVPALTFTPANWNTAQTVTVTAVDDVIAEGPHVGSVSFAVTSADAFYNGAALALVSAAITDNDAAGVTVTESGGSTAVSEDGTTDSFTVVLDTQPTADVIIDLASTDLTEATVSPLQLTFTAANWNVAQAVTVTGVDDPVADGAQPLTITTTLTSADALYAAINPADVSGTNADNDTAGVTVTETGGGTAVTEGGATDTFTVVLTSQPTADVSIALTGSQVTTGAPALTFTPANWNTAQAVTVTAVDDAIAEGTHAGSVSFAVTSADALYNGAALAPVSVTITDNDNPGVILTPPTIVIGEGGTIPATIQLGTQPTGTVVIQIIFDPTQTTVNGETDGVIELVFTSANWNIPVPLLIIALPNGTGGDSRLNLITIQVASSTAPEYPPGAVSGVAISITIVDVPPPPPTPLCEAHNFDEGGVVRSSIADALGHAINCRILYQNGASTTWLGGALYSEANLGVPGLLELGVLQAIDIFSPGGQTYFEGGAVFCLRGQGTLIWLAASGAPRVPAIIGSYTVPEHPGFTCATLFEPGTLVLVADNPVD